MGMYLKSLNYYGQIAEKNNFKLSNPNDYKKAVAILRGE